MPPEGPPIAPPIVPFVVPYVPGHDAPYAIKGAAPFATPYPDLPPYPVARPPSVVAAVSLFWLQGVLGVVTLVVSWSARNAAYAAAMRDGDSPGPEDYQGFFLAIMTLAGLGLIALGIWVASACLQGHAAGRSAGAVLAAFGALGAVGLGALVDDPTVHALGAVACAVCVAFIALLWHPSTSVYVRDRTLYRLAGWP